MVREKVISRLEQIGLANLPGLKGLLGPSVSERNTKEVSTVLY